VVLVLTNPRTSGVLFPLDLPLSICRELRRIMTSGSVASIVIRYQTTRAMFVTNSVMPFPLPNRAVRHHEQKLLNYCEILSAGWANRFPGDLRQIYSVSDFCFLRGNLVVNREKEKQSSVGPVYRLTVTARFPSRSHPRHQPTNERTNERTSTTTTTTFGGKQARNGTN